MLTILVVDDVQADRLMLQQLCEAAGHQVVSVTSGEEALQSAKKYSPDLVLLDIIMEGMNGFQVCRELTRTESTAHIPVVLVSSKGERTDAIWAEQNGAMAYIKKPATQEQINEVCTKAERLKSSRMSTVATPPAVA